MRPPTSSRLHPFATRWSQTSRNRPSSTCATEAQSRSMLDTAPSPSDTNRMRSTHAPTCTQYTPHGHTHHNIHTRTHMHAIGAHTLSGVLAHLGAQTAFGGKYTHSGGKCTGLARNAPMSHGLTFCACATPSTRNALPMHMEHPSDRQMTFWVVCAMGPFLSYGLLLQGGAKCLAAARV